MSDARVIHRTWHIMPYHSIPSVHPNIVLRVHTNDPLLLMTKIIERMQGSRVKPAVSESGLKALSNI
jgi:hypothetical protein